MFNLFGSKDKSVKINDKVWISTSAKLNACRLMAEANPQAVFVCWFDDTAETLKHTLPASAVILRATDVQSHDTSGKMVIFAEHHPLSSVEQNLFEAMSLSEVPVLSALDEAFFEKFGGERTIELMRKLGVDEKEALGHSMITKAIRNAQDKIAAKTKTDHMAVSQREWLQRNL
jgi:hypothetical protein